MEQSPSTEQFPLVVPEAEITPEITLNTLAGELGFHETDKLTSLRIAAIEASTTGDVELITRIIADYQQHAELAVSELTGEDYARAQIGLIVATATLRRDSGRTEACRNDMQDALEYAQNMGYDGIAQLLDDVIAIEGFSEIEPTSQEVANMLAAYGDDYGFDLKTCQEIAELPFEEALEMAYGYLVQAGLDPDEVLAPFIKASSEE